MHLLAGLGTATRSALDEQGWNVLDWTERFAAWELIANFTATLVATAIGVWIAVAIDGWRSRQRHRRRIIERGIALADEAERYPRVGPIEDISVMAVAFPLWLAKDQLATELNETTPALGAWVLWRLQLLHVAGSEDLHVFEVRAVADEVRDALRGELKRRKRGRPTDWYSNVLRHEHAEFTASFDANLAGLIEQTRLRMFPHSTTLAGARDSRRRKLSRAWLAPSWRRRKSRGG